MSAPNKATEKIAEFAMGYWADTDFVPDADDIEDTLYAMAHSILACDGDVPHPEGEPFPEWTTLVITTDIAKTIDYNWVAERVRAHLATLGVMGEEVAVAEEVVEERKITFAMVMDEYDDIKPHECEDYYNWRVLLNYINKNKALVKTAYDTGGVQGALKLLFGAEDGEFVAGFFGEAYDNCCAYSYPS